MSRFPVQVPSRFAMRYAGYYRLALDHLPAGPDRDLMENCNTIMVAEVRLRDLCRRIDLTLLNGADACGNDLKAELDEYSIGLSAVIAETARMAPVTEEGLWWKSDALIHLLENVESEALPAVTEFAVAYARDVRTWLSEAQVGADDSPDEGGETHCLAELRRAQSYLESRDVIAGKVAVAEASDAPVARSDTRVLQITLASLELGMRLALRDLSLICPRTRREIAGVAELVLTLRREGETFENDRALRDLERNLAEALRERVGCHAATRAILAPS